MGFPLRLPVPNLVFTLLNGIEHLFKNTLPLRYLQDPGEMTKYILLRMVGTDAGSLSWIAVFNEPFIRIWIAAAGLHPRKIVTGAGIGGGYSIVTTRILPHALFNFRYDDYEARQKKKGKMGVVTDPELNLEAIGTRAISLFTTFQYCAPFTFGPLEEQGFELDQNKISLHALTAGLRAGFDLNPIPSHPN